MNIEDVGAGKPRGKAAQMKRILASINASKSRLEACEDAGVTPARVAAWMRKDRTFRRHVEQAEVFAQESRAFRCAGLADTDPRYQRSLHFWLERRAGWSRQSSGDEEEEELRPTLDRDTMLDRLLNGGY